nr:immunoglobulin heavy chain junction region [Macaca mulatta]MOX39608.1 immunoglobulin heavy chain junction region [Macaca mulatta]
CASAPRLGDFDYW